MAYRTITRRPRAFLAGDDYIEEERQTCEVVVDEDSPIDTGLVDHHGNKIMRITQRGPMGFCRE